MPLEIKIIFLLIESLLIKNIYENYAAFIFYDMNQMIVLISNSDDLLITVKYK